MRKNENSKLKPLLLAQEAAIEGGCIPVHFKIGPAPFDIELGPFVIEKGSYLEVAFEIPCGKDHS